MLAEIRTAADDGGTGTWTLSSKPLDELAACWTEELVRVATLTEDDPDRKLPTSLRFRSRKPRDPDTFSDELRGSYETAMRYAPSATHTYENGTTIAAYGQFVQAPENGGLPARVFVYDGPSLARVAVALAAGVRSS